MNLYQLKLFSDLIRQKSFIKTAKMNYCTQPAVSMQIKLLEEEIGCLLFERTKKNVEPTEAALKLEPIVVNIIDSCEQLKSYAKSWYGKSISDLKIATTHSIGIYQLSPYIKAFLKSYPKVNLHIDYWESDVVYDMVANQKIDFGFVSFPLVTPNVEYKLFGEDEMVVIMPREHELAGNKTLSPKQLHMQTIVAYSPNAPTQQAIEKFLTMHDVKTNTTLTTDNIEAIKDAVEIGLGMAIVPDNTVQREVDSGTLVKCSFAPEPFKRPVGVIYYKKHPLSFIAKQFLAHMNIDYSESAACLLAGL